MQDLEKVFLDTLHTTHYVITEKRRRLSCAMLKYTANPTVCMVKIYENSFKVSDILQTKKVHTNSSIPRQLRTLVEP